MIYRARLNEVILIKNNLVRNRSWNPDTNTYEDGALNKKDEGNAWIGCPLRRCFVAMIGQMYEIFAVANIVGGTIVILLTKERQNTGKN